MTDLTLSLLALLALGTNQGLAQVETARIEGIVVNGTQNGKPLAGAEVILRAGEEGLLQVAAQTVTDQNGRFVFDKLSSAPGLIYLPGANHHGIHYPGPRVRLPGVTAPPVTLTVFDAVASPNPLIADLHEIDVRIQTGVLEVTETLWVNNPSVTTYVGVDEIGTQATTLSLLIPDGFERVTFDKEFTGRRFQLQNKRLVTDIAWTPGKREVKFTYHLPIEAKRQSLEWSVSIPCARVRLRLHGEKADEIECNLPSVAGRDKGTLVFESTQSTLAANHVIQLQLGNVPTPWIAYLRWIALGILVSLILATAGVRKVRRSLQKAAPHGKSQPGPLASGPKGRKKAA